MQYQIVSSKNKGFEWREGKENHNTGCKCQKYYFKGVETKQNLGKRKLDVTC